MHQFIVVEHEVLHRHYKVQRFFFFLFIVVPFLSLLGLYKVDLPPCVQWMFSLRVFWNYCGIPNLAVAFYWKRSVECDTSDDDSSVLTITNRKNIYPHVFPSLLGAT